MSRPGSIARQPAFASWWKHLRPFGKRQFAKSERKAAAEDTENQTLGCPTCDSAGRCTFACDYELDF